MSNNIYKRILRELEKGNAVFLDVGEGIYSRVRIVTPSSCVYSYYRSDDTTMTDSCFIHYFNPDPKSIVRKMETFDRNCRLKIKHMRVL